MTVLLGGEAVNTAENTLTSEPTGKIRDSVTDVLEAYFADLNGYQGAEGVYQMVLREVERPMLEVVLKHTRGNQTKAADLLGINRGTLRKKLREHGLD
jgi:Fis family transcriptional regulator